MVYAEGIFLVIPNVLSGDRILSIGYLHGALLRHMSAHPNYKFSPGSEERMNVGSFGLGNTNLFA